MSTGLRQYNTEIMAITCPKCTAGPRERCRKLNGEATGWHPIKPHAARIEAARTPKETT